MEVIPTLPLALALAAPFVVTFFALWLILFKPLMAYLAARDHAIHGARHDAATLSHESEKRVVTLEGKLTTAREEITAMRGAARARAIEQQNAILHGARGEALAKVSAATVRIAEEHKQASGQMQDMSVTLSRDIAGRILGRQLVGQEA